MKKLLLLAIGIIGIMTVACGPGPTPTPLPTSTLLPTVDAVATETRIAANIFGTQTASAPTATHTFTPSPTPLPTDTATPTSIPTDTATPTLVPTETRTTAPTETQEASTPSATGESAATPSSNTSLPDGWRLVPVEGAEIALPTYYVGGDMEKDLPLIIAQLRAAGPEFENQARILEQAPEAFRLWAFKTELGDSGFLTNVNMVTEPVLSFVTIDLYLEAVAAQLPDAIEILETETLEDTEYPTVRVLTANNLGAIPASQVLYIVRGPDAIWMLSFSSAAEEFERQLSEFDSIFETFRLLP